MAQNSQRPDDYERQMAQRRRNNTIILLLIGLVLVVVAAFSSTPGLAFYLVGIFIVIGILLYARSIVEKNYHKKVAEARKAQEEKDNRSDQ